MKPRLTVTCYPSRRGVISLAGSLGFYYGDRREGLSLIKWSLESRHSKPVSEPAKKEIARLKPRCGFRHSLSGRELGAGFAFALLGLRSHSRHSHPLRMNFQSSELAHEEPVAELPPSPSFRAADTSFSRLGSYAAKVHESAAWFFVRMPKHGAKEKPRCWRKAVRFSGQAPKKLASHFACELPTPYGSAGSAQEKSLQPPPWRGNPSLAGRCSWR